MIIAHPVRANLLHKLERNRMTVGQWLQSRRQDQSIRLQLIQSIDS